MPRRTPTLADVAKRANVAVMTACRAMNADPSVRRNNRERVLRAAKELGYAPSVFARCLKRQVSDFVLISLWQISNPFFGGLVESISSHLRGHGLEPVICDSVDKLLELHRAMRPCGCLLNHPEPETITRIGRSTPVVTMNGRPETISVPDLTIDFKAAYCKLTSLLIAQGRKRIAFCIEPDQRGSNWQRKFNHVQAVLKENAMKPGREFGSIPELVRAFGSRRSGPQAIFCQNDPFAVQVLWALQQNNIHCPEDVIVIGCDGTMVLDGMWTVDVSQDDFARQLVTLLIERMAGGNRIRGKRATRLMFQPRILTDTPSWSGHENTADMRKELTTITA